MKIIKTGFKDLIIFKKESFKDNRGFFRELFLKKNIKKEFIFDVMSLSKKNVIRGLHLQTKKPQGKLITVMRGKIFDVALDCRIKSKTFGNTMILAETIFEVKSSSDFSLIKVVNKSDNKRSFELLNYTVNKIGNLN